MTKAHCPGSSLVHAQTTKDLTDLRRLLRRDPAVDSIDAESVCVRLPEFASTERLLAVLWQQRSHRARIGPDRSVQCPF